MTKLFLTLAFICASNILASDATVATIQDQTLKSVEREIVSLAEAMPAGKYSFAPTEGEFKGVRTFAHQMSHIATINYMLAAALLGEKCAVEAGSDENGDPALKDKDAIVKYMKDSFAYSHKALATMTAQNFTESVTSPFGGKDARGNLAEIMQWHSFDHYGQAVVYARMNGIIPPASRPKQ